MATSPETARLTQAHLAAQLGIRASVLRDIRRLFPMWNPFRIGSLEAFAAAVTLLAQQRAVDSAALAARYFEMFKEIDLGLTAGKAVVLAAPPSVAQVQAAINATAVAGYWRGIGNGLTTDDAKRMVLQQLSGSMGRLAMQGGRRTLTAAIGRDDHYRGRFIRVTDGAPCAFCAMLAGRGPVYLSADSAGASRRWHDHCGCSVMPYSGGEWPAENLDLHEAWQAMKSQGGSDLKDFRTFLERNAVPERDRMAERRSKATKKPTTKGDSTQTPALAAFERGRISGQIRAIEERAANGTARVGDAQKLVNLREQLGRVS